MDVWIKIAAVLEYGILVLLFLLSVWSFAIMIDRRRILKKEHPEENIVELRKLIAGGHKTEIQRWIETHPGVHAGTIQAAIQQTSGAPNEVDRAVRSFLIDERMRMEKGLPVLATLGSNTPFIGLFGTVLGIIRAFAALGDSSGAATSVMSGISQALVATAAGLFVAIPAVVAFNSFSNKLRIFISQSESLKDYFVAHMGKFAKSTPRTEG